MSLKAEYREIEILKCIQINQPCIFSQIRSHLEKNSLLYKGEETNRKPLSKDLVRLESSGKITKNKKTKPYPTYSMIQDYSIDTAIMGDLFKMNFTKTFFTPVVRIGDDYIKNDIPLELGENENEKFIKSMVTRYGFYMLSVLVKSYEQSIKLTNFDRKIWINSAMDLMKDEESISSDFLNLLEIPFEYPKSKDHGTELNVETPYDESLDTDKHPELLSGHEEIDYDYNNAVIDEPPLDLSKKNNENLLKEKLEKIYSAMKKTYPKMSQSVMNYEYYFESNPEKIRQKDFNKMNRKNWPEF